MEHDAELERPTQDEIQLDLMALCRGAVRLVLEAAMEEQVRELVGAGRWERLGRGLRKDHRNGSYLRRLVTSMGAIDVAVPRTRENGSPVDVVGRYRRRMDNVDEAIVAAYVQGVSTRKMGKVTTALMGEDVKSSTVSRVTKVLEERVEKLRRAPIDEPIGYLYLDATFLDARWARSVENVSALVAYGVGTITGRRRLLGIAIGAEESEDSWAAFLAQLIDQGLHGVSLVIADAHAGLIAAVRKALPEAKLQRCVVHLMRNCLAKAPHRLRKRLGRELHRVFTAGSLQDARKCLAAFQRGLGTQLPEALECLDAGFSAAVQFYSFPKAHWKRIRSTNGLERLHGEVKRRIRSVGAFPDRASALRLVTAVAVQATDVWGSRRYLDMSLLDKNTVQAEEEANAA